MLKNNHLILLILGTCLGYVFSDDVLVTLPSGNIHGRVAKTFKNITYYAFQEVPYAAPPLGKLRFKAPQPVEKWDKTLETTKNTKVCMQDNRNSMENEDCLYLNVYTPVVPGSKADLPVLVYIHGGGFYFGWGVYDGNGPEFYIETGKIVVVTVSYRLGIFGFLSTEDDVIPGNFGLKDQNFALQWVRDNIHLFGGDRRKVTLNGQSAGSASVSYHVLSKQSEGLFRAAIYESGTALSAWGYQRYANEIAYKTGAAVDSSFTKANSSKELLELLQKIDARKLENIALTIKTPTNHVDPGHPYTPVVEKSKDGFLTDYPYEIVAKGDFNKVVSIIGMNSEESLADANDLTALKKRMAGYDNNLARVANDDFHVKDEAVQETIGKNLRKIYTDGLFQDDLASSVRFISDCRFTTSIIKYAELASQFADVYFYQFSYDGDLGGVKTHIDGAESVAHAEELAYLWRTGRNQDISKFPEADVLTHRRLIKLWTNFVTDLNPTFEKDDLLENITWPLVKPDKFQYLDIRKKLSVEVNPKNYGFKTWDSIYQKYGVRPFDTL